MTPERRDRGIVAGALALAFAALAFQALLHRDHFVDDAFIGFRYAQNLAAGHGAVWNPGAPPVEGVTNLGWVAVLAFLAPLSGLPAAAKAVGLGALAATLLTATLLHRRLVPQAGVAERAALPLLLVAQPELVYFALAGMETGLAALLVTVALGLALGWKERPRATALGLGVLAIALFLLRPEMALVVPLFLALRGSSADRDSRRGLGVLLAVTLSGLALVTAWRLSTFGQPLPNTFAAKSPGGLSAILSRFTSAPFGGNLNLPPPFGLGLAVLGFGAWRLRRNGSAVADLALATTATGVAFAIYARPDWTEMGRYFGPFVPAAALLLLRGAAELAARVAPAHARAVLASAAALLVGHGAVRHAAHLTGSALAKLPGFVLVSDSLREPAQRIAARVPREATVACRRIGVLGFFGGAQVFDFAYGLTEPEVARLLRHTGLPFFDNARTPALAKLWRQVEPDFLLEDWTRLESWLTADESPRHFHIHGVPYELIATFPIAEGHERWALARRIPGEPVLAEDDWSAGAERVGPRDPLHP